MAQAETGCCLEHCCILDGCNCLESENIHFVCCLAVDIGYPHYPLCDEPGGCRSEEFTCAHTCCSIRDDACCNPCFQPGGCLGQGEDRANCCIKRLPWAEIIDLKK